MYKLVYTDRFTKWLAERDESVSRAVMTRLMRAQIGNFGDCKQLLDGIW